MSYRKNPSDRDQSAIENQAASSGIRFPWFNGATGRGEMKTIPAYDLQPNGNNGGVSNNASKFPGGSIGDVQNDRSDAKVAPSVYPVISGTVHDVSSVGIARVDVFVTGSIGGGEVSTTKVVTDSNGRYSTIVPMGWTGSIAASSRGAYQIVPVSISLTNITKNTVGQNFQRNPLTVSLSGRVVDGSDNPVGQVLISANEQNRTMTEEDGTYNRNVPFAWTGALVASKDELVFSPLSIPIVNATGNQVNLNFSVL